MIHFYDLIVRALIDGISTLIYVDESGDWRYYDGEKSGTVCFKAGSNEAKEALAHAKKMLPSNGRDNGDKL